VERRKPYVSRDAAHAANAAIPHEFLPDFQEGTLPCRRCGLPEDDKIHIKPE
jgi:hypothetical protein